MFDFGYPVSTVASFGRYFACVEHATREIHMYDMTTCLSLEEGDSRAARLCTLSGAHKQRIDAMAFGSDGTLFSVSVDCLVRWPCLSFCDDALQYDPPQIMTVEVPRCTFICLSPYAKHIILGYENSMLVIDGASGKPRARFDGHTAPVSHAAFFSKSPSLLVSVSEDRTFKLWDIVQRSLIYESGIESNAHPLVYVAVDSAVDRFSISSSDGRIRLYEIVVDGVSVYPKLVFTFDCSRFIRNGQGKALRNAATAEKENDDDFVVVSSKRSSSSSNLNPLDQVIQQMDAVARLQTVDGLPQPLSEEDLIMHYHPFYMKYAAHSVLYVSTPRFLCAVNMKACEPLWLVSLQQQIDDSFLAGCLCTCSVDDSDFAVIIEAFSSRCEIVPLLSDEGSEKVMVHRSKQEGLSIHASGPFPDHFVSTFAPPSAASAAAAGKSRVPGKSSGTSKSNPIVFHSKIRSTGYGKDAPWKPKPSAKKKGSSSTVKDVSEDSISSDVYPDTCDPISCLDAVSTAMLQAAPVHNGPIFCGRFSPDGKRLITGGADQTLSMIRFRANGKPKDKYVQSFVGHKHSVTDVHFGHSNGLFISSSNDGTARIWSAGRKDALLVVDRYSHTVKSAQPSSSSASSALSKAVSSADSNTNLPSEVKNARFFAMDKYVALASANRVHVYKYLAEEEPESDLNRQLTQNRFKCIERLQSPSQSVSCMACANAFYSSLFICGTSARSIEVYDVSQSAGPGTATPVLTLSDAHARPLHQISLCEPNPFASTSFGDFELFLSNSLDGFVKLWDLRSGQCVQSFTGSHQCRSVPVACSFSPCMRFVVVGSEDNCAYMYDRRTARSVARLPGAADTVSVVALHPQCPTLVAGSYDSKLRLYQP